MNIQEVKLWDRIRRIGEFEVFEVVSVQGDEVIAAAGIDGARARYINSEEISQEWEHAPLNSVYERRLSSYRE